MRSSRADFKNALAYCRKNEVKIRKEIFIRNFKEKNMGNFWKGVKNSNPKQCISKTID